MENGVACAGLSLAGQVLAPPLLALALLLAREVLPLTWVLVAPLLSWLLAPGSPEELEDDEDEPPPAVQSANATVNANAAVTFKMRFMATWLAPAPDVPKGPLPAACGCEHP